MSKVRITGDLSSLGIEEGNVIVSDEVKHVRPRGLFSLEELNWTEKQKKFIELCLDKNTRIILCKGPAGSSKTLTGVYSALNLLNAGRIEDVIYMRSAVESSDSKLGFLPGDAEEKLFYYNLPFMDKLDELLNCSTIKKLQREEKIKIHPVNFARGMSWNHKAIIFDEAQNSSLKEIITVLTRIGKFSRLFVMADPMQTDLKNNKGGFEKIYDIFSDDLSKEKGIHTFEFGHEDIMRSELTKYVVSKLTQIEQ